MPTRIDRRAFLRHGAAVAGAVGVAAPFQALLARSRDQNDKNRWKNVRRGCSPDYGPLLMGRSIAAIQSQLKTVPRSRRLLGPPQI